MLLTPEPCSSRDFLTMDKAQMPSSTPEMETGLQVN